MNACNESVGNTPERERAARLSSPPADPTPAAEAPGQTAAPAGSSLDRWLLTRLRTYLGDPPIELAVRAGARAAPADGAVIARVTFASRATLLAVLSDPWLRFGDAYSDGSVTVDGDLVSLLETVYRSSAASGTRLPLARRAASLRHRPHANTLARLARQHPPPLRYRQPVLPAVARRDHGLHLRLLPDAGSHP